MKKFLLKTIVKAIIKRIVHIALFAAILGVAIWYYLPEKKPKQRWFTSAKKPQRIVELGKHAGKKVGLIKEKKSFYQRNKSHIWFSGTSLSLSATSLAIAKITAAKKNANIISAFKAKLVVLAVLVITYELYKILYRCCYLGEADLSAKTWGETFFGKNEQDYGWLRRKWIMHGDTVLWTVDTCIRVFFVIMALIIVYGGYQDRIADIIASYKKRPLETDMIETEIPTKVS